MRELLGHWCAVGRPTDDERPFRGSEAFQSIGRSLEERAVAEQGEEEFGVS
jgi:hypothetical protein